MSGGRIFSAVASIAVATTLPANMSMPWPTPGYAIIVGTIVFALTALAWRREIIGLFKWRPSR